MGARVAELESVSGGSPDASSAPTSVARDQGAAAADKNSVRDLLVRLGVPAGAGATGAGAGAAFGTYSPWQLLLLAVLAIFVGNVVVPVTAAVGRNLERRIDEAMKGPTARRSAQAEEVPETVAGNG